MSALPAQVLSNRDEFHFGSDDALTRIVHLRHARTLLRAQRRAEQRGKILQTPLVFLTRMVRRVECQVPVINRLD